MMIATYPMSLPQARFGHADDPNCSICNELEPANKLSAPPLANPKSATPPEYPVGTLEPEFLKTSTNPVGNAAFVQKTTDKINGVRPQETHWALKPFKAIVDWIGHFFSGLVAFAKGLLADPIKHPGKL